MTTEEKLTVVNAALPKLDLPEAWIEADKTTITIEVDTSILSEQQIASLFSLAEKLDMELSITSHRVYLQVESLPEKWN